MAELGDYMGVVSTGFYPTPTPSAEQRAYLAASYGLMLLLGEGIVTQPTTTEGLQSGDAIRILHAAKAIGII